MSQDQQINLLTQINQKLQLLVVNINALVDVISKGKVSAPDIDDDGSFDAEFQAAINTPTPGVTAPPAASVELDSEGMPWDERIHAKTKTKTAKGAWKKGKGVDPAVMNAVTAELRAKYPFVDVTTAAPTPPGGAAPTPPGGAAPTPPGGAAPTPPAVNAPGKKEAMQAIAVLTDEFNVDYGLVLNALEFAFQVKTFDELSVTQYPSAKILFESWVDNIRDCDEEAERIIDLGKDPGKQGVVQILSNNGVGSLAAAKQEDLTEIKSQLASYRVQWENFVNANA